MGRKRRKKNRPAPDKAAVPPRDRNWLVVGAVALAARLLYLMESADQPTFYLPVIDSGTYHNLALSLAAGQFPENLFWQPILYPLFLALSHSLSGGSVLFARIVQMLLGCITAILTCHLAARLADRRTGLIAGLLVALYPPLIFYEGELLGTGLAALCMVGLTLMFTTLPDRPGVRRLFAVGLVGGVACLSRPTFLPVAVICTGLMLWKLRSGKSPGLRKAAPALVTGLLLPLLIVAMGSSSRTGSFTVLPASAGINSWIAFHPDYCSTINIRPGYAWEKLTRWPLSEGAVDKAAEGAFYRERVLREVGARPLEFALSSALKLARFFSPREMPRNLDMYTFRPWSVMLSAGVWRAGPWGFPFGLFAGLALGGLWIARRRLPLPYYLIVGGYALGVAAVFAAARFRMPLIPVLAIPAAIALLHLWQGIRQRQPGQLLPAVGGALIIGGLALFFPRFCEEDISWDAELRYVLGTAAEQQGNQYAARDWYRKALQRDPSHADARHNLGFSRAMQGDHRGALAEYEEGLRMAPNEKLLNSQGQSWSALGRTDRAESAWIRALEMNPRYGDALNNMGRLRDQQGRRREALAYYRRALAANPHSAVTHNNLGAALAGAGRNEEARAAFSQALRLDPTLASAWNNLGIHLYAAGKFDEAEKALKKAVIFGPGQGTAWYTLARISWEKGRSAEARRHLDKANASGFTGDPGFSATVRGH